MSKTDENFSRVIAYVDGFNLYFGLKSSNWQRYYWLDVQSLAESVLPPESLLEGVKYFTSRIAGPEDKRRRQNTYLEALQAQTFCEMVFGRFQQESSFCRNCFHEERIPKEKMTDVNIAVEMMKDAFSNRFDTALLISGDSDLTPPVRAVRQLFPEKRVIVGFPPNRRANDLEQAATSYFTLVRSKIRDSQLPDEVIKPDGYVLKRPDRWR